MLSEWLEYIPYVDDCYCIMLFDTSLTKRWIFYLNIFFFFCALKPVVSYAIVLSTLLLARSTGVLSNDFR